MLNYRLALDLGTNSLGWAIIKLDSTNEPNAIIKTGVRIFSDGRHPKTGASLAVERRNARQMRRRRDRLIKRQKRMLSQLTQIGCMPETIEDRKTLENIDPYFLRAKALTAEISPFEFGRVVMHLCKRRGFKSNRKTDGNDNELGALKKAIRDMQDALETTGFRTLGEWLHSRHQQGLSVRARLRGNTVKTKKYDFYADRSMIEHEFDTLWTQQQKYSPEIFSEKNRCIIKDTLLFQRELLPVVPGRCTLLPDNRRAPLALPSTQEFRILQELNNLRVLDESHDIYDLTVEKRNRIYESLQNTGKKKFSAIKKDLKLPSRHRFNLASEKRDGLTGNITAITLRKSENFGPKWDSFSLNEQDSIVNILTTSTSEDEVVTTLMSKYDITHKQAISISRVSLPQGYGNLSEEAIKKILPHLKEHVITYDKAVVLAGFDSHSQLTGVEKTGEVQKELPYYGIPLQRHVAFEKDNPINEEQRYGKIANPTVHIGLNQIRIVVNALIKQYGLPAEINVEVTRELKTSKKVKDEISKQQALNQKRNEANIHEACEILELTPENLDRSKRRELSQKMQLWKELNIKDCSDRRCPFSGEQISISRLLSDDIEIEHILPYSRTLDDSMNNKTLATRYANRIKTNKTPWEAFGANQIDNFDYDEILARAGKMPDAKARRFNEHAMEAWSGENDFLARALNDTAYLSKIARAYLSCICPPAQIQAIPGRLTGMIRGKLGLNSLLSVDGIKNRHDHRHHAIDAVVVGVTDRAFLASIAKANSNARSDQLQRLITEMPLPWPTFREHVTRAIGAIKVSHKPDHGYQGQIMEAKSWGLRQNGSVKRHEWDESSQQRKAISKKQKVISIADENTNRHGFLNDGSPRPYKGYVGGSNYCIDIVTNGKKWKGMPVSTYAAYSIIKKRGTREGMKVLRDPKVSINGNGEQLVMRLMRDDCVCLNIDGLKKYMRVQNIRANGQISFAEIHESNVDGRDRTKEDAYRMLNKSASSLQKLDARIITISPTGEINSRPLYLAG